jgi:uncharacterized membrane protein YqjE
LQNRLELLAVEFKEEKARLIALLAYGLGALFLVFLALAAVTVIFVALFPDYILWILAAFSAFYFICFLISAIGLRKAVATPLFGETISQLEKDRQWMRGEEPECEPET